MGVDRATQLLLCVHCVVPQPLKFCFYKHVIKRFSFSIRNQGRLLEYLSEPVLVVVVLNTICPLVCFPNIVMMVKLRHKG